VSVGAMLSMRVRECRSMRRAVDEVPIPEGTVGNLEFQHSRSHVIILHERDNIICFSALKTVEN
jgi:hypothetical protein